MFGNHQLQAFKKRVWECHHHSMSRNPFSAWQYSQNCSDGITICSYQSACSKLCPTKVAGNHDDYISNPRSLQNSQRRSTCGTGWFSSIAAMCDRVWPVSDHINRNVVAGIWEFRLNSGNKITGLLDTKGWSSTDDKSGIYYNHFSTSFFSWNWVPVHTGLLQKRIL